MFKDRTIKKNKRKKNNNNKIRTKQVTMKTRRRQITALKEKIKVTQFLNISKLLYFKL